MPNNVREEVRVIHKDRSYTLTLVNGCLGATTLNKFFPEAAGLVYTKENDTVLLDFDDNGLIKVKEGVDTYGIYTTGANCASGASVNNSSMQRLRWLQQRKEALQSKLNEKNIELKKLCVLEAELTGVIPLEIPLEAGESPPIIHRKTGGSSVSYSENLMNKPKNNEIEESAALEVERQIQIDIAKAALSVLNDPSKSKAIRRKNRSVYQQSQRRIQELDAELNFIRHSHGSGLRLTQSYMSLHGSQNLHRIRKPCSPLNLEGKDYNLNIDEGVTLSPVGQEHNFNSYVARQLSCSHHQSTVSLDHHPKTSNRKFIEDHLNVNNNLYTPPEPPPPIRNRTYSQNSLEHPSQFQVRSHHQQQHHHHHHRSVPNTYTEEERQKRRHQSFKLTQKPLEQFSPEHMQPLQPPVFQQPPPYKPTPSPVTPKSSLENKSKSVLNTYLPHGYWARSGDEIVWCSSEDQDPQGPNDKFGSLDRRKNILQHSSNFGPSAGGTGSQTSVTRHHTVAISSKSQINANQQKQPHPILAQAMDSKFLPRKALTRTQSLGNVETWYPVQDSVDAKKPSEIAKLKEKEWIETSVDGVGVVPKEIPQPQMSVRNVKRASHHNNQQSGISEKSGGRVLTGREPVRSNSIPANRRLREQPLIYPQNDVPALLQNQSSRVLEIPAESSLCKENEYDNKIIPQVSPNNHTIVQVGTYQPYREQVKPFEMSDFYKYSTKFRKSENPNDSSQQQQQHPQLQSMTKTVDRVIQNRLATNQQSALANFALR